MTRTRLLLIIPLLTVVLRGASPADIAGAVLVEDNVDFRRPSNPTRSLTILHVGGRTASPYSGASGEWSYRKTGPDTGTLTRSSATGQFVRELHFSTERTGDYTGGQDNLIRTTFTFIPFNDRSRVANNSVRTTVTPTSTAQMGFIVGEGGAYVLVRAIGPGLRNFGVSAPLDEPRISVIDVKTRRTIARKDRWTQGPLPFYTPNEAAQISGIAAYVGAFPLSESSRDSALVMDLEEGAYVATVESVQPGGAGEVLLEIYTLP